MLTAAATTRRIYAKLRLAVNKTSCEQPFACRKVIGRINFSDCFASY